MTNDQWTHTLTAQDFADMMGMPLAGAPAQAIAHAEQADFRYNVAAGPDREACLLKAVKALEQDLDVSGPERIVKWESGWGENLKEYLETGSIDSLQPKYFHYEALRFRGDYIHAGSVRFEQDFYTVVRYLLFQQYLSEVDSIVEFGCGPGTSLLVMADLFPEKPIVGCDWAQASQGLVRAIAENTGKKLTGVNFDFFNPHDDVPFTDNTGVVTLAALEQVGPRFEPFLNYVLEKSPTVCVHLEPIVELYDEEVLFDYVAQRYHRKRGYLEGFLTALRTLEQAGHIEILDTRRLQFGSFYQEGYSLVMWKPLG